jgi:hypothetical protein
MDDNKNSETKETKKRLVPRKPITAHVAVRVAEEAFQELGKRSFPRHWKADYDDEKLGNFRDYGKQKEGESMIRKLQTMMGITVVAIVLLSLPGNYFTSDLLGGT